VKQNGLLNTPRGLDGACMTALAAATILAFVLGVRPALQRHSEVGDLRASVAAARDEARELAQTIQNLGQERQRLENEQSRSQITLSGPDQRTRVLRDIAGTFEAARPLGLRVGAIDAGETAPAGRHLVTPIAVTGRAPPGVVRNVLVDLRRSLPDVGVRKLVLARSVDTSQAAGEFSVELTWFAAASARSAPTQGDAGSAVSGVGADGADR